MNTYKAVLINEFTTNLDDYHITNVLRVPPKGAQVEVQVHAAAVNKIDYGRAAGALVAVYPNELPMKIGYDVAGIVTSVGTHATKFKVGDRVYGCVNHDEIGTIAEYVLSEEAHLAELPSNIEFTAGASVPLAGLTAKQAMDAGHAEGKETIFVSGGMGGVGMFGVALARHHFKAQNVLTTVSTSKVEYAKKMGATQVVDYTKEDHTKVLESAADMVFDSIGDTESYKVAKPNTVVASVVPISDKSKMDKVLSDFKTKNVRYVLNITVPSGPELERTFNPLLESKELKPIIPEVFEFTNEGVRAAFKRAIGGHVTGKVVIRVRD